MRFLRPILAAILVGGFALYGVAATAPPHAHGADDFHVVHVIAVDTHDRGHHGESSEHHDHGDEAGDFSGIGQDETDLHAHGAPHFTEAGATIHLTTAIVSDAMGCSSLSTLLASRRAAPPFKPPRLFL